MMSTTKGIGFHLEAGDGYFFFTRKETKVDLQRKLEAVSKWIDYLTFLKTYNSAFGVRFGILCGGYRGENQLRYGTEGIGRKTLQREKIV